MTNEDLVAYLTRLGLRVTTVKAGESRFIVARAYAITAGQRAGERCDVGLQWSNELPYVMPSAVHVRPHLVPMGSANSQASPLGPEWQYLSRKPRNHDSPALIVAHLNSVLAEL